MNIKNILNIIPTVQSAQLAGENLKVLDKKKTKTKDMLNLGVKNVVGIELIKAESGLISTL